MRIAQAGSTHVVGAEGLDPVRRDLQRLRKASAAAVGSVFFGTLLRTMRNSRLKGTFGHGGRGEDVFAAQLDQLLAERIGRATNTGLQEVLFDRLKRQQEVISRARAAREQGEKP